MSDWKFKRHFDTTLKYCGCGLKFPIAHFDLTYHAEIVVTTMFISKFFMQINNYLENSRYQSTTSTKNY